MPIRRNNTNDFCDICRAYWDRNKQWMPPVAVWRIESESIERIGNNRLLCQSCAEDISNWNGATWEIQDQIKYGTTVDVAAIKKLIRERANGTLLG